jgi:peptidoglycan hydrolase CwlO-like protein
MTTQSSETQSTRIHVENIGGINVSTVSLEPGVNVLVGRNVTNRTSFLRAITAVFSSEHVPLKTNADHGRVELELDGETHVRTLQRRNGDVVTDGTPYSDDPEAASLFAFLLQSNEERQAVTPGADLRDLIMRPVNTEAIRSEIASLEAEKSEINDELERLDALASDLSDLEAERQTLQNRIAEKKESLERVEREIEAIDVEAETEDARNRLEECLAELHDQHASLEEVRYQMGDARQHIGALRKEREECESRLEELVPDDADNLDDAIENCRDRTTSIKTVMNELETAISLTESVVERDAADVVEVVRKPRDDTDDQDTDDTVCWACGNEAPRADVEQSLDGLRTLHREKLSEQGDSLIELSNLKEHRAERDVLRDRLEAIEEERVEREEELTDLREWRRALNGEVANLRSEIDDLPVRNLEDLVDRYKEADELGFEIERLQDDLTDVSERIADIEKQLEERDAVEARRNMVRENLTEVRNRIDRVETEAVDQFNTHVAAVLERLEYDTLERVWLERSLSDDDTSTFTLKILRSTGDVMTHYDRIEHLSESEREVIGVVFALTGYIVHDVCETAPFVLLDSIEAIDSDRIASLVEYLAEYTRYLVVALQNNDVDALDTDYHCVTDI